MASENPGCTVDQLEYASQSALASHIASLLPDLAPTTALENEVRGSLYLATFASLTNWQPFRLALREFLGRGNASLQEEITTWLSPRKRRKTPDRPHPDRIARQFFEKRKEGAGRGLQGTCVKDLLHGLICLREACKRSADDHRAMWEHRLRAVTSPELRGANRQQRVIENNRQQCATEKEEPIQSPG